ncbi:hypothetical protein LT493_21730 [Streptomyces tricolor]|nr:hypothetical protein [Streptomyces tricolor]
MDDAGSEGTVRAAARACPQLNGGSDRPVHATDEAVLAAAGPDPGLDPARRAALRGRARVRRRRHRPHRGRAARAGGQGRPPRPSCPACSGLPAHAAESAQALAGDGLRVLAVAERRLDAAEQESDVLNNRWRTWSSPACWHCPTCRARRPRPWCRG